MPLRQQLVVEEDLAAVCSAEKDVGEVAVVLVGLARRFHTPRCEIFALSGRRSRGEPRQSRPAQRAGGFLSEKVVSHCEKSGLEGCHGHVRGPRHEYEFCRPAKIGWGKRPAGLLKPTRSWVSAARISGRRGAGPISSSSPPMAAFPAEGWLRPMSCGRPPSRSRPGESRLPLVAVTARRGSTGAPCRAGRARGRRGRAKRRTSPRAGWWP